MKLNVERKCSENNCDRPFYGKGLCNKHWNQKRRAPFVKAKVERRKCSENNCGRIHYAKGLCTRHYQRVRNAPFVKRPNRDNGATLERNNEGKKFCITCKDWLLEERFTRNPKTLDHLAVSCKSCITNYVRYRQYKVTPEKLRELFALQNNVCAICKKDISCRFTIDLDHLCFSGSKTCGKYVR